MNIPVNVTKREELPTCFGREWDKNVSECAGGPDPAFTNPKTGLHVREQCNFFQACGARTQAQRAAAQQQQRLIPTSSLFSHTQPPTPTAPPTTFSDYLRQQQASYVEAQRLAATGRPITVPQQQQQVIYGAAQHPAPMYQLNYMMPGYLSVPEERQPGEGLWGVLLREVFRSIFKALGHSVSHFFDSRPIRDKKP